MNQEEAVSDIREIITDLAKRVALCDASLDPIRRIRKEIEAEILMTHKPGLFNWYRAEDRAPLFSRLLYIAEQHGPAFNERKVLYQRMRAYERELEKIKREIDRVKKRKAKQDGGQMGMFE